MRGFSDFCHLLCADGHGNQLLLTSQLAREFPDIAVECICPMREGVTVLREEGIGLIISTVRLHIDFPHIVVSVVLQLLEDDLNLRLGHCWAAH